MTSPHIHSGNNTQRIMLNVIIALMPALLAAIVLFGFRALTLTVVTVSAAVIFEIITRWVMKKDVSSVFDLSAVVTGLIIALSLAADVPFLHAIIGTGVAIIVVKQFFGGLGRNPINPAMVGHVVAGVILPRAMGMDYSYPTPFAWLSPTVDAVSSATPLQLMLDGYSLPSLGELFLGIHHGMMGETSILALLIGAAYLLWRRIISPTIPLVFVGAAMLTLTIAGKNPIIHLFTGGLVFCAFFMATDYATSPISLKGKIIFGIGCGLITAFIRLSVGSPTEGITVALIVMNLLTPLINRLTLPKAFGSQIKN